MVIADSVVFGGTFRASRIYQISACREDFSPLIWYKLSNDCTASVIIGTHAAVDYARIRRSASLRETCPRTSRVGVERCILISSSLVSGVPRRFPEVLLSEHVPDRESWAMRRLCFINPMFAVVES